MNGFENRCEFFLLSLCVKHDDDWIFFRKKHSVFRQKKSTVFFLSSDYPIFYSYAYEISMEINLFLRDNTVCSTPQRKKVLNEDEHL